MRDHLQAAYKSTGVIPQQLLEFKELPQTTAHIWSYFSELHSERDNNGMTPRCITSTGIKDWCQVSGIKLERWEIRAIRRLDQAWMEFVND